MFYVYEWFIVSTGEIIYVGKGSGKRYKVTKHNNFFNDMIRRFECDSRIIKTFENEIDAFNYEYVRIEELRKLGQCVCNIRYGGFGGTKSWWTDEIREKYSKNNVMKSEQQRKRMSINNPMKNKKIATKVGKTKRRPVIIGDIEYSSVKEAHEILGVAVDTIQSWCIKGKNSNGQICKYKDGKIIHYNKRKVQDNQQPSQTNSDNSSLEGSTTNE